MAGDEHQRLRVITMRERNAGVCGASCGSGYARHDFEAHAGSRERFELLAAAAEDERIAALEPAHALALLRELHEQRVDLVLRHLRVAGRLADVDALSVAPREIEDLGRHEPVVQNHVCILQRSQRAQRQQPRIAGTGADQHDFARDLGVPRDLREGIDDATRQRRVRCVLTACKHVGGERAVEEVFPEPAAARRTLDARLDRRTQLAGQLARARRAAAAGTIRAARASGA